MSETRKIVIEKEISKCTECPLRRCHVGHGERWDYCDHENAPKGYDNVIGVWGDEIPAFPSFCPFG